MRYKAVGSIQELVLVIREDYSDDELFGLPTDVIGFSGVGKEVAVALAEMVGRKEVCFFDNDIKNDSLYHYLDFEDMLEKSRIMVFTDEKYLGLVGKVSDNTKVYFVEK